MKHRFIYIIFVFHLLGSISAFCQTKTDSLKKAALKEKDDSVRASLYLAVAKLENKQGRHDTGVIYASRALDIGKRLKNLSIQSTAYSSIGLCYHFSGDYKKALSNYIACQKIEESRGNKKSTAKMFNNIGVLYADQRFYDLAEKSYLNSYKIYKEINDTSGIIQAGNNLGALYGNKSAVEKDSVKSAELVKKALEFNTQTFEYAGKIGDSANISNALANLGQNYMYLGNYKKALGNMYAALEIERRQDRAYSAGITLLEIGDVLMHMKQYPETIKSLNEALAIGLQIQNPEIIKYAYSNLAEAYAQTGEWKSAFLHHRKYSILSDSLINSENTKQINELQIQYETAKKDKENTVLQEKNNSSAKTIQQQRYFGIAVGFICVLLVAFALVIFRSYKQKHKINTELEKKNILIEKQKELVEIKQKEILDSIHYAKKIQSSLLTSEKYIERNMAKLRNKKE